MGQLTAAVKVFKPSYFTEDLAFASQQNTKSLLKKLEILYSTSSAEL